MHSEPIDITHLRHFRFYRTHFRFVRVRFAVTFGITRHSIIARSTTGGPRARLVRVFLPLFFLLVLVLARAAVAIAVAVGVVAIFRIVLLTIAVPLTDAPARFTLRFKVRILHLSDDRRLVGDQAALFVVLVLHVIFVRGSVIHKFRLAAADRRVFDEFLLTGETLLAPLTPEISDVDAHVQQQFTSRVVIPTARFAGEIVAFRRQNGGVFGLQVIGQVFVRFAQLQTHAACDGGFRAMEANQVLPQMFLSGPRLAAHLAGAFGVGRLVVHLARVLPRALAVTRLHLRQRHEIRHGFLGRQLQIDVLE